MSVMSHIERAVFGAAVGAGVLLGIGLGVGGTLVLQRFGPQDPATPRTLTPMSVASVEVAELRATVQELAERLDDVRDDIKVEIRRLLARATGLPAILPSVASSASFQTAFGDDDDDGGDDVHSLHEEVMVVADTLEQTAPPLQWDNHVNDISPSGEMGVDAYFSLVDSLLDNEDDDSKVRAYKLLQEKRLTYGDKSEFMWRLSRALFLYSELLGHRGLKEDQKSMLFEARHAADRAVELDPSNGDAHKYLAVMLGSISDYLPLQDRVKDAGRIKEHITRALASRPADPMLHHMLGRWCYSIASLSWLERRVVSAFMPSGATSVTTEEARDHFLTAERLNASRWKENLLYVSKCYLAEGAHAEARQWLTRASEVDCVNSDDAAVHSEVLKLLQQYQHT